MLGERDRGGITVTVPVRIGDGLYLINRVVRVVAYPLASSTSTNSGGQPTSGIVPTISKGKNPFANANWINPVVQDTPRTVGIIAGTADAGTRGVASPTTTPPPQADPVTVYRPTGSTVEITGLRVQFDIEKSLTKHPNKCEVTITNMSAETRQIFEKRPVAVSLEAGHDDVYHALFFGDQIFARSEFKRTDWDTLVQVGDGSRAFNFARVNKSYRSGTSVLNVLRDVAASMGQELPRNLVSSDQLRQQFASGIVVLGPARDELTRLLAPYGYHWSMQDGRIQVLKDDEVANGQAILVQESTGMIGSPAYATPHKNGKPPALHIKMLLYPGLRPGMRVKVVSETVNGLFRIEKVVHKGDTHGSEWESLIEAQPTTAGDQEVTVAPPRVMSLKDFPGAKQVGNAVSHRKG